MSIKCVEDISKIFAASKPYELTIKLKADYFKVDEFDNPFRVDTIAFEIQTKKKQSALSTLPIFEEIRKSAFPFAFLVNVEAEKNTLKLKYSFEPEDREYYNSIKELLNSEIHVQHERLSEFIECNNIREFKMAVTIED